MPLFLPPSTNKPVGYGTVTPFPPDVRMIAGGAGQHPQNVFWACFNGGGSYDHPPVCPGTDFPQYRIHFPNCWDRVRLDSPDHRSHIAYPKGSGSTACPTTHPVKLPFINFFVRYPHSVGGPGWILADGTTLPHADFWNTWQQAGREKLVRDCLTGRLRKSARVVEPAV